MKNLVKVSRVAGGIGVALGVTLGQQLFVWLAKHSLPPWFSLILTLAAVVILSDIIREATSNLVSISRPLRRLILGRQDIEGTWIEVTGKNGEVRYVSLIRLEIEDETVRISGENFDEEGKRDGTFLSDMLVVTWPVLKYKFTAVRAAGKIPSYTAYGQIQFAERDGPPTRYHGFFLDFNEATRNDFSGWRLRKSEELTLLDQPDTFGGALLDIAKEYLAASTNRRESETNTPARKEHSRPS